MKAIDEDRLLEVVGGLYEAEAGAGGWHPLMQRIGELVSAERVTFLIAEKGSVAQDSWPLAPEGAVEYVRDYAPHDLRFHRIVGERRRGVFSTGDLMSADEIAKCPIHHEFYKHWPECWNTLLGPTEGDNLLCVPSFHRSKRHGSFKSDARQAMHVIARHLSRAARVRGLTAGSQLALADLSAAFECFAESIFMLDDFGRISFANGSARDLLRGQGVLSSRAGMLVAEHDHSARMLDAAVGQALAIRAGASLCAPDALPLHISDMPNPLIAMVAPLPRAAGRAAVLIRVRHPDRVSGPTEEMVRQIFGLTAAEARLSLALAAGSSLVEYSAAAGISEQTARTHLRNIREKMGVGRVMDVVRSVLSLAPP